MGKPRTEYKNKFLAENYERINIALKKGRKEIIKTAASAAGMSVNGYIEMCIARQMKRDGIQYGEGEE